VPCPFGKLRAAQRRQEKGRYTTCPCLGGDAGNRTRVRRNRPWMSTGIVAPLVLAPAVPERRGPVWASRWILSSRYRRRASSTPDFVTPTLKAPGGPRGERDTVIGCQGSLWMLTQPWGAPRDCFSWHLKVCPVFTRSRRLGLQSRTSLPRRSRSSPFLLELYHALPTTSSPLYPRRFSCKAMCNTQTRSSRGKTRSLAWPNPSRSYHARSHGSSTLAARTREQTPWRRALAISARSS
jgi:hypothetical protein